MEEAELGVGRYLRSTLPFDTNNAVVFVTERGQKSNTPPEDEESGQTRSNPDGLLTGDEAKEFYEEVLAIPEQRTHTDSRKRTNGHLKSAVREKKPCKKSVVSHKSQGLTRKKKDSVSAVTSPFQLFQYAQTNQLDLLESALSDHQYDINLQDNFHWTLLMVAAYAGHMAVVQFLMAQGAKWREFSESRGMNAADLARTAGHLDIVEFIENYESCEESNVDFPEDHIQQLLKLPSESKTRQNCKHGSRKQQEPFYCDSCQTTVTQRKDNHDASIVHRYNNQERPPNISSYGIPESNRGFQMMLRSGWNPEGGLGSQRQGKMFPVKTVLKKDRSGIGLERGKAKVTHFPAHDKEAVRSHRERYKKVQQPVKTKKELVRHKQKEKQWERRLRTSMNLEDSHLLT